MNKSGKGGFSPGESGNPGGRPKAIASLQIAARQHMHTALKTLLTIAKSGKSEASRVAAATVILDRGFGRPVQSLEMVLDANLVNKKLSDLTPTELAELEGRLVALGAGQADLFGDPGSHGVN